MLFRANIWRIVSIMKFFTRNLFFINNGIK
nr:MAG TPA: hypothetical protein [Caudoviricetes sp.]